MKYLGSDILNLNLTTMEGAEKVNSGEVTQPPGILVNLVLGTIHMWHLRGHRSNVVDLIVKHFTASELLEGRKVLCMYSCWGC